jgi:hypothetical protein
MGMCSSCKDHADFVEMDEEPTESDKEEVETLATQSKIEPVGQELLTAIGTFRYNAVIAEHGAHEIGDNNAKQYWRGQIDAIDLIDQTIRTHLGIIS